MWNYDNIDGKKLWQCKWETKSRRHNLNGHSNSYVKDIQTWSLHKMKTDDKTNNWKTSYWKLKTELQKGSEIQGGAGVVRDVDYYPFDNSVIPVVLIVWGIGYECDIYIISIVISYTDNYYNQPQCEVFCM